MRPDGSEDSHERTESFDGFRLIRSIGSGAMGEVFLADDTVLERPVAIKLIRGAADPDRRRRFLAEARAIARLRHPNVVAIYRLGEVDGRPYLVTELVRGKSLEALGLPLPAALLATTALGLARALAAAHREGVLHKDIKPANVLLSDDGEIKLVDFGLAELVSGASPDQPASDRPRDGATAASSSYVHGTPLYMAPELFLGERAAFATDVYAVGAVLYHLASGQPPYDARSAEALGRIVIAYDAQPLMTVAPWIDERMCKAIERCMRRRAEERWSCDELTAALEALAPAPAAPPAPVAVAAPTTPAPPRVPAILAPRAPRVPEQVPALDGRGPYPGLHAFEAEDRQRFFGREAEAAAILERLRAAPWVLVAADSGIGKSSLCRAGVLPAVIDGQLRDEREWSAVTVVPGRRPLTTLIAMLARYLGADKAQLAADIAADLNAVGRALQGRQGKNAAVVIFVDQLEELVTLSEPDEARSFAEVVDQLGGSAGVRILSTVRLDFLTRLAPLFGSEALNRALYVLGPLSPRGIREAVVAPARAAGVRFESEAMVETLVASATSADGGLPLLQFALAELWRTRDATRAVIPQAALDAIGGVTGALSLHADAVLGKLTAAERDAARAMLGQLVTAESMRARATDRELATEQPERRAAIDALVRGRLVIAREAGDGTAYEIAHEALIHGWGTLRAWLAADAELRELRGRVAAAAAEWERLGGGREGLWRDRQLAEARRLAPADLGAHANAFVAASSRSARRRRGERLALFVGIPLVIALAYGGVRWNAAADLAQRVDGDVARARDMIEVAGRTHSQLDRARTEAYAGFDRGQLDAAERRWAEALRLSDDLDRDYARALQQLDSALVLDGTRADVRAAMGDLLYARAAVADELHRAAQAGESLDRLELFDDGGERRRRWHEPARLTIDVAAPASEVTLARVVSEDDGRRRLEAFRELGAGATHELELPPGAYLISATSAGRAPLGYPVALERGEHLRAQLTAPPAQAVPSGFVYVPAGRFLFGYSADESMRKELLGTVPLHPVTTPAYLIAKAETTWAEWIAYLEALPAEERGKRTPRIATVGFHGALALDQEAPGQWRLTMQPNTRAYVAKSGEKLRYAGRTTRAEADWRRFPVAGISVDDAQAYVAWLAASGRVPGARLCSELEWERAARGADDRLYPHGDSLAADDANFDETYGKQADAFGPDEVGSHPVSTSVFGLADMSGNVWEWTTSSIGEPGVVARGGSFYFARLVDTVVNRQTPGPDFRDLTVGMRVCASIDVP